MTRDLYHCLLDSYSAQNLCTDSTIDNYSHIEEYDFINLIYYSRITLICWNLQFKKQ